MGSKKGLVIPKGERLWVSYFNGRGELAFILTSKEARDFYFLYEVSEGHTLKKLGKSRSPTELERKFSVNDRLSGGKGGG